MDVLCSVLSTNFLGLSALFFQNHPSVVLHYIAPPANVLSHITFFDGDYPNNLNLPNEDWMQLPGLSRVEELFQGFHSHQGIIANSTYLSPAAFPSYKASFISGIFAWSKLNYSQSILFDSLYYVPTN